MPRKVTISVDFTVLLNDNVKTSDVTFEIDVNAMRVDDINGDQNVGKVLDYCTQENPE